MINEIKEQIKSIAVTKVPQESCGLVIKQGESLFCYECKNIAENKLNSFVIDPKDYVKASRLGKIEAMFHSQPNDFNDGESQLDIINSKNHDITSIIYSWKSDSFFEINPKEVKIKDYLKVPFEIGKNDCFSLLRNYYNNELNIQIKDYNRDNRWDIINPSIIEDNYKQEGFTRINISEMKKNDVILFAFNSQEASHIGIYLGNDVFLHHPRNKYPAVEFLNKNWSHRIKLVLRHKNFIKENGKD